MNIAIVAALSGIDTPALREARIMLEHQANHEAESLTQRTRRQYGVFFGDQTNAWRIFHYGLYREPAMRKKLRRLNQVLKER